MVKLDTLTQLRLTCGLCNGIAILTTIFRISIRIRKSQLWVDDLLALLSMCALMAQLIAVLIDPNHHNGVVRYYLIDNMFFAAVWLARLSTLFSIIRITRNLRPNHHLFFVAALFLFAWIILTAQIYWECETKPAWKDAETPQCSPLSRGVPICQLIADIISDGILLFVPIRLFMIIQEKELRYRLMVIFGTCIITTIVSFVHTAFLFEAKETPVIITGVVENAMSLVVCNVPIMVTTIVNLRKQNTSPPSESAAILHFAQSSTGQQQQHQTPYPLYTLRAETLSDSYTDV